MSVRAVASYLGPGGVERLAGDLRRAYPAFPARRFIRLATTGLEPLSLFGRATHLAGALDTVFNRPFRDVIRILVEASGPPRTAAGYGPMENFRLLAFTRLISLKGLPYHADSMWGLRNLTQRFTGEFDIRPFLQFEESKTLRALSGWAEADELHVRRLVSEGSRSRLPWGVHLRAFQRNPTKALSLIEPLKSDNTRYVQLSVANNLADIIKDNAAFGLDVAERWIANGSSTTKRIVRHAVRLPAKRGCVRAMALRDFEL
jgi:3-methyladenine DNA glycosylase AlkC